MTSEKSGPGDTTAVDAADRNEAEAGGDAAVTEVAESTDRTLIDPRGPRFGAAITVVVLAVALLTIPSITSVVLLVIQAIAFGAAALLGIQAQPYGWIYRKAVAPRLRPPRELEDPAPPRFAQQVGLVFVLVALFGLAFSAPVVAQVATAFALAAAFLNAVFNFCLGCEMYLLFQRVRTRRAARAKSSDDSEAGGEASAERQESERADADAVESEEADAEVRDAAGGTDAVEPQEADAGAVNSDAAEPEAKTGA